MLEKPESKLGGTLIKKIKESKSEGNLIEIGRVLINRDSGDEYVIDTINETGSGFKVVLRSRKDSHTVVKSRDSLSVDLITPDSPWKPKE